ncbi:MAG: hypothetical protein IJY91_00300 [Oscillospiraceae bacterium]|nr:hypothetical protein [Oscillospiraceae bacterium]
MGEFSPCNCKKCGRRIQTEKDLITAFDIQKGYESVSLCSKSYLNDWVNGKIAGMVITVLLGLAILIIELLEGNAGLGFVLMFMPYMIRHSIGKFSDDGILGFIITILGSVTIVYPIYKLYQEIRDYTAVKKQLS